MATVRLYGHAGSDVQGAYLPKALIEADEARDPLLAGAALMTEQGWMTAAEIADAYADIAGTLARQAEAAILRPKITHRGGDGQPDPAQARGRARQRPIRRRSRRVVRQRCRADGQAPAYGAAAVLGARRPDADAGGDSRSGRGCRDKGRRLECHRQAPPEIRFGGGRQKMDSKKKGRGEER